MNRVTGCLLALAAPAAALLLWTTPVRAATQTNTFQVSVDVVSGCALGTTPDLDFGQYISGGPAVDGTTTVTVTCSSGTAYVIALNHGNHYGSCTGINNTRCLSNPSVVLLAYNLYTDSGHTNVWEDTNTCGTTGGSSANCQYGTGDNTAHSYTVYGEIPTTLYPGGVGTTFTDTITVTVTY